MDDKTIVVGVLLTAAAVWLYSANKAARAKEDAEGWKKLKEQGEKTLERGEPWERQEDSREQDRSGRERPGGGEWT